MLTVKQAARRAAISVSLVYAWCRQGALSHTRFGRPGKRGTIRIDESVFEQFLLTMKVDEQALDEGPLKYIR